MSTLNVTTLRGWEPSALDNAADEVDAVRRRLDDVSAGLRPMTRLGAAGTWTGDAASAAAGSIAATRNKVDDLVEALLLVRRSLRAACDALTAAQSLLLRADVLAAEHGLAVSAQGWVTFRGDPVAEADAMYAARSAERMATQALQAAWEADRDAALAVGSALTGTQDGSGTDVADHELVNAITTRDLPAAGATPGAVAAWWATLAQSAQAALLAAHPREIGNLDGLPVAVRDQANRVALANSLAEVRGRVASLEDAIQADRPTDRLSAEGHRGLQQALREAQQHLEMIEVVETELHAYDNHQLMVLDPEMPGRAAIAVGDVDTADHVAVLVPGFSSAVTNYLPKVTANAHLLVHEADFAADRHNAGTVAAVAWIGYHAPRSLDVLAPFDAIVGADALSRTVNGLHEGREASGVGDPHLTVVGHSYGSLVSGYGVQGNVVPVDDFVIIGSPGVGADDVTGLGRAAENTFVGVTGGDVVGHSGYYGTSPEGPYFGATTFQVDGGHHPLHDENLLPAKGHSQYYWTGTESLANIASVVIGRPDQITVIPPAFEANADD